jgi:hypothetical protein
MIFDNTWFEVWFSPGENLVPTWILIVVPDENEGCIVYDPQENYKVVYRGKDYESTFMWLREDEYELVEGRTFPDDGFPLPTKRN